MKMKKFRVREGRTFLAPPESPLSPDAKILDQSNSTHPSACRDNVHYRPVSVVAVVKHQREPRDDERYEGRDEQ